MSAHGKRYNEARATIDRETNYSPAEALKILKALPNAKFDETIEAHFRLGLNVRHADQQLRGTLMLPHGHRQERPRRRVRRGATRRARPKRRGADVVGAADLAAKIEGGFTDFDVAIATPDQMGNVGKLGRVLGPRGLMPNPKTGTVTFDVGKAVSDAKAGKLEYRTDRGANVHVSIGKKSFGESDAARELRGAGRGDRAREAGLRQGPLHPGLTLTSTMGAGLKVDPAKTRGIVEEFAEGRSGSPRSTPVARDKRQRSSSKVARGPAEASTGRTGLASSRAACVRA
jgi:large subunit ribosomal protein L1